MDLRHIVSVDHANIRQVADQLLRSASAAGPTGRDRLFDQLDDEVRRHLTLMTGVIMPAAESRGGTTTSRDPHASHKDLERTLDGLRRGDKDGAEWTSRFEAFSDELDRVFGEHTQTIAALGDDEELARRYERAKLKAIRSGGYVSRWRGNRKALAGLGLGLAAAAVAAALWRRRGRADASDIAPTQRRLSPPSAYGRAAGTSAVVPAQLH